ncbi:MAG: M61 family metallopeptidase [Terriglobales bacterium]
MKRPASLCSCLLLVLALTVAAAAQTYRGPQPVPYGPPIPPPVDTAYPGVIQLQVNITDVTDRVYKIREQIPVSGRTMALLYPQWIPGNHSPTGPISKIAGLEVLANGQRIPWLRDPVNVYAFWVHPPAGAQTITVKFEYLASQQPDEGRIQFDHNLVDFTWNDALLYPAGYFSRDIEVAPSLRLPAGWKYATALSTASRNGANVHFADVPLNTLVDSPLYAGVNFERLNLSDGPGDIVHLDVFADTPAELKITPQELQWHKNLVVQARRLFGAVHYRHYDFLLTLSSSIGFQGLEHHQSSEDGTWGKYFTDWAAGVTESDLLSHEYTHSWNGKFRRPAALWTPNFNVPMRDRLLWVYEGLTQYWGYVLAARSGLRTVPATRDLIAAIYANQAISPGRDWRPLRDTTNQPTISQRRPVSWVSWQRDEDYYMEGLLIWLNADAKLRQLSHGQKSLDDFAKLFYGQHNGSFVTRTYDFQDLVRAMNQVQPYDWAHFFRTRVDEIQRQPPIGGITLGGYRVVYNDHRSGWMRHKQRFGGDNFATSLGLRVGKGGNLTEVWWDSPAFRAGITLGMRIVAVNGHAYSPERLSRAIVAAEPGSAGPITLLLMRGDRYHSVQITYHGGLRIPHLERVPGMPDRLDAILAPVP